MNFKAKFITATEEYCTYENYVPAPYIRKSFTIDNDFKAANICISGHGFYRLFINGTEITKGALAPYITNPNQIIYYDLYDCANLLTKGENVIGIILGNGIQNNMGGYIWDFHNASWRSAPKVAFNLDITQNDDTIKNITSDETAKVHSSPITFDDVRSGEFYDARLYIPNWNKANFDDTSWENAKFTIGLGGDPKLCEAPPIVVSKEIKPVKIISLENGFIYDFGVNTAGVTRLKIKGEGGQVVNIVHGEILDDDNNLDLIGINKFAPEDLFQKVKYTLKGGETEEYTPSFTYFGFRYAYVTGITNEQATEDLLTMLVQHSDVAVKADFSCSDEMANKLQEIIRVSSLSNFYYYPTDCPQREKNGWTGDIAISAEHLLLNLDVYSSLKEWLHSVRKMQSATGGLPSIIPTDKWGYDFGTAWDLVLVETVYQCYRFSGDIEILKENAHAILRYVDYIDSIRDEDGLTPLGLGDWVQVGRGDAGNYTSPTKLTNTLLSMDACKKAAFIFSILKKDAKHDLCMSLYNELKSSVRKHCLDLSTMTAVGNCQTSQAMAIYYDAFNEGEKNIAFDRLLDIIYKDKNMMNVGVLGGRVLFHVLSNYSYTDLAFEMITTEKFPSYGNMIARGATSLWENFDLDLHIVSSLNHHFWGDITNWFIKHIAGLNINPTNDNINRVLFKPRFIDKLNNAKAHHILPLGTVSISWVRTEEDIEITLKVPAGVKAELLLENDYEIKESNRTHGDISGEMVVIVKRIM